LIEGSEKAWYHRTEREENATTKSYKQEILPDLMEEITNHIELSRLLQLLPALQEEA
jgi:hypothetical protein